MARRRRRTMGRKAAPGSSFWLRTPPTDLTLEEAANSVYSALMLTESDFQTPNADLNNTLKGAPVIERLVVDVSYNQIVDDDYFRVSAHGQVTMLIEAMVYVQDDQFVPTVDSSASFDTALENNRILGYEVMKHTITPQVYFGSTTPLEEPRIQISCRSVFTPKTRVKIRERSICVAIRGNFNSADASIRSTFPYFQSTFLVRVP